MIQGYDFASGAPSAQAILDSGARFVCRYLSSTWKGIRHAEYVRYVGGGVAVVANYENTGQEALGGYAAGVRYAHIAETNRVNAGIPVCPIFFSVDFEPAVAQLPVILDYLDGIASVIGRSRTGVYGSYDVIEYVWAHGGAAWLWQTYAWSRGRLSAHAHIWQYQNGVNRVGTTVDLDEAFTANYGAVGSPSLASVGAVTPITPPTITPQEEDDNMRFLYCKDSGGDLWTLLNTATGLVHQTRDQATANVWAQAWGTARSVSAVNVAPIIAAAKATVPVPPPATPPITKAAA